ncbi:hypothetical protein FRC12_024850 [Ceratobasidium sp. 428]|nr:hypothetical protein FRC12_024850 [Ceratobasidium sp. 428]
MSADHNNVRPNDYDSDGRSYLFNLPGGGDVEAGRGRHTCPPRRQFNCGGGVSGALYRQGTGMLAVTNNMSWTEYTRAETERMRAEMS